MPRSQPLRTKNSLYDSYVRAIRWASDRIKDEGIVAFVSNGGYIDGNTADGLRRSLVEEFDAIYCYNLRGNQRTAGELSRKEGGKIFGSGSRNTVAILILVKGHVEDTSTEGCALYYRDIGDYLSREEKLRIVGSQSLDSVDWQRIHASSDGDWISQRDEQFATFRAIGEKEKTERVNAVFEVHSGGLKSGRDPWVYNFSRQRLANNMKAMIDFYNQQVIQFMEHNKVAGVSAPSAAQAAAFIDLDEKKISWNEADKDRIRKGTRYTFDENSILTSAYRPFSKQWVYFNRYVNQRTYQLSGIFPHPDYPNFGFYITGTGSDEPFSVLMTNAIPDLHSVGTKSVGPYFARYRYRQNDIEGTLAIGDQTGDYERLDNVTTAVLRDFQGTYSDTSISKDDIFYYTYGLLHSPEYRKRFAADLKRSLPRIPKVRDLAGFAEAGRKLADLHINYEKATPYKGIVENVASNASGMPPRELYRVVKMKIPKVKGRPDLSTIIYNNQVTLTNIPQEAYSYQLGTRSAIEWVIDRYQVKVDKASEIVNDPNDWSNDPRYIIDVLKKVVTVSVETMRIVNGLPALDILEM